MKKEDFVIKIERLNRGFLLSFPISFPDYNFQRIIICAKPLKIKNKTIRYRHTITVFITS